MKPSHALYVCTFLLLVVWAPAATAAPQQVGQELQEVQEAEEFQITSDLLTDFWGREMTLEASVVVPADRAEGEALPVCFNIHGFGGSHRVAATWIHALREQMAAGEIPRMLYVFLNAQFSLGHHEFADSVNNGPWGTALVHEFIPALEEHFGAVARPEGRFLTGHSSGGWSSLWLQVTWPDFFGGTWSTAPDSIDFRDFCGMNLYEWHNVYVDPQGNEHQLIRSRGKWRMSLRDFATREVLQGDHGGQMASFDAVFSPRGEDGRPMPMFDRDTGDIDPFVATAWKKYDIGLILRENWKSLGPRLAGKIHIYVGTEDTFRLEGATRLVGEDLARLGSDAEILLVEGRDHGSLMAPHEELWPTGMMNRIHQEMGRRFADTRQ